MFPWGRFSQQSALSTGPILAIGILSDTTESIPHDRPRMRFVVPAPLTYTRGDLQKDVR